MPMNTRMMTKTTSCSLAEALATPSLPNLSVVFQEGAAAREARRRELCAILEEICRALPPKGP